MAWVSLFRNLNQYLKTMNNDPDLNALMLAKEKESSPKELVAEIENLHSLLHVTNTELTTVGLKLELSRTCLDAVQEVLQEVIQAENKHDKNDFQVTYPLANVASRIIIAQSKTEHAIRRKETK